MHPSKHVLRSRRRAAARVAAAVAGGALLCTAATGPALASAHHSRPHKSRPGHSRPHRPAAHTSAQPPASGGWADYYTSRTVTGRQEPVLYELAVRRVSNGDLSLDVFRLGGGSSVPQGGDVIRPGWILLLPASGSTPAGPAGGSAGAPSPPVSGGWADSYTVPTAQDPGEQVLYELAVKMTNGGLSLEVFQFGGSSSQPGGGDVIRPGWILLLPASGSAPSAPTGPAASGQGTAGGTQHSGGQHSGGQQGGGQQSGGQHSLASATAPTSARLGRAAVIGAAVLIALLLAIVLLIRRRRRNQRTGQPDRRDPPRLSLRPGRRGRAGGQRGPTVGAPSPPALASDPRWAASGAGPAPALPMPASPPVLALSDDAAGPDDASWPDYLMPAQPAPVSAAGPRAVSYPGAGYPAADHPLPGGMQSKPASEMP